MPQPGLRGPSIAAAATGAVLFALPMATTAAVAQDVWTNPYTGIMQLDRAQSAGPLEVRALIVDLCTPGIRVRATAPTERTRTVASYGALVGAAAAINADFFDSSAGYVTSGLALGDGMRWAGTADDDRWGLLAFGERMASLSSPPELVEPPPAWMHEVIGGVPQVVLDGVPVTSYPGWSFCAARHPRSSVGLSADRRSLIMAVADGRSDRSIGMTCAELGNLMAELGAHDAINLDGGGSTTLWTAAGGVINHPSDGSERTVANHLGVLVAGGGGVDACPSGDPPPLGGFPRCGETIGVGESRTIDTNSSCFQGSGPSLYEAAGVRYTFAVACGSPGPRACSGSDTSARWYFNVASAGSYRIEVRMPAASPTEHVPSRQAPYAIRWHDGQSEVPIDQQGGLGDWTPLGDFSLAAQNNVNIELHDNSGEPYVTGSADNRVVIFDAVRISYLAGTAPSGDGGVAIPGDGGAAPPGMDAAVLDPEVDGGGRPSRPGGGGGIGGGCSVVAGPSRVAIDAGLAGTMIVAALAVVTRRRRRR